MSSYIHFKGFLPSSLWVLGFDWQSLTLSFAVASTSTLLFKWNIWLTLVGLGFLLSPFWWVEFHFCFPADNTVLGTPSVISL